MIFRMKDRFIFWQEHLRVNGPCNSVAAALNVRSLVTVSGIAISERLVGSIDGDTLRVWRNAPLAQAGDVVEFRGVLRADGKGSVIEGFVGYSLRTKSQFVGCLVLGVLLTAAGLFEWTRAAGGGPGLAGIGAVVTLATLAWIYSSRKLAWKQIAFIEEQLNKALRV